MTPTTQIPIKIPPGMPAAQAQALLAYLQQNPEAAKAAHAQVGSRMQSAFVRPSITENLLCLLLRQS